MRLTRRSVSRKRGSHAAREMIEKHTVDPEGLAGHLRIGRAVDLPLLQLVLRLTVVDLHGLEKRVPVEGLAGLLLDEADESAQFLDGVVLHRVLIVADGHAVIVRREVEIPVLIRRRGDAAVARHVAGDKARAELGILVAQGAAGLGRGQGATSAGMPKFSAASRYGGVICWLRIEHRNTGSTCAAGR